MNLKQRKSAFIALGKELLLLLDQKSITRSGKLLEETIPTYKNFNGWYSVDMIRDRLRQIGEELEEAILEKWLSVYEVTEAEPKNVAVILAGNIPLVGFDDLLCVLMSGNNFMGKLSSDDKHLLPMICNILVELEPAFQSQIRFQEDRLAGMDAVIATGSNNSGMYFEHYFGKYPHIIRRNRTSIAVLNGKETTVELEALTRDIFLYYGLGCRSISKIFVPIDYNFNSLFEAAFHWGERLMGNNKYMNNYEYNKTIHLLNNTKLLDNNFFIIKEDIGLHSPPGVLFFEYYTDETELKKKLRADHELIQCKVGHGQDIPFGEAQKTYPWNYADGVDVMKFLLDLNHIQTDATGI